MDRKLFALQNSINERLSKKGYEEYRVDYVRVCRNFYVEIYIIKKDYSDLGFAILVTKPMTLDEIVEDIIYMIKGNDK